MKIVGIAQKVAVTALLVFGAWSVSAGPIYTNHRLLARYLGDPLSTANSTMLKSFGASMTWRSEILPG